MSARTTQAQVAERRTRLIRLRAAGTPWETIAAELGYASPGAACTDLKRALEANLKDQRLAGEEHREVELAHLDELRQAAMRVLGTTHLTVSHGRVIQVDGKPLEDDGPILQAVATLLRVAERRARLLGLDAPTQVVSEGTVRYEVVGVDPADLT